MCVIHAAALSLGRPYVHTYGTSIEGKSENIGSCDGALCVRKTFIVYVHAFGTLYTCIYMYSNQSADEQMVFCFC